MSKTEFCIRCDEKISVHVSDLGDEYISLTYNHEASALPICPECLAKVEDRDLW